MINKNNKHPAANSLGIKVNHEYLAKAPIALSKKKTNTIIEKADIQYQIPFARTL